MAKLEVMSCASGEAEARLREVLVGTEGRNLMRGLRKIHQD